MTRPATDGSTKALQEHDWGQIGRFMICKKCCCLNTSPKATEICDPSKAKLRPMEKPYDR